jgi:hypothetical protein
MCFSNDEAARDDLLHTLWSWKDAPNKPKAPRGLGRIQTNWLKIADVFHLYCDLVGGGHQKRRGGPSISKAVTLTSKNAKRGGTSRSKLWEIWKDYKDVAHLVSAASLVCAEVRHRYGLKQLPHLALDPGQIAPFQMTMLMPDLVLAAAIDFQDVGLAIGTNDNIRPVLDPDTLWRIPTDKDLNIAPVPLPFRKLTKKDHEILRDRRAGNRGQANLKPEKSATVISSLSTRTGPEENES